MIAFSLKSIEQIHKIVDTNSVSGHPTFTRYHYTIQLYLKTFNKWYENYIDLWQNQQLNNLIIERFQIRWKSELAEQQRETRDLQKAL
jgi:hypothetical protein